MLQCGNLHSKIKKSQFLNKRSQAIDSAASTFEGLRYKEIDMVNSYN